MLPYCGAKLVWLEPTHQLMVPEAISCFDLAVELEVVLARQDVDGGAGLASHRRYGHRVFVLRAADQLTRRV